MLNQEYKITQKSLKLLLSVLIFFVLFASSPFLPHPISYTSPPSSIIPHPSTLLPHTPHLSPYTLYPYSPHLYPFPLTLISRLPSLPIPKSNICVFFIYQIIVTGKITHDKFCLEKKKFKI